MTTGSTHPGGRAPTTQQRMPVAFGENFIDQPDLFPARQSGEPWGPERVAIHFAGNDYVCDGLSAVQAEGIRRKFGRLCAATNDASRPTVEIRIFRVAPSDFVVDDREWEFEFDLDYAPAAISVAGFHVMGRLDWTPRLHAALWTSEDGLLVERAIFENLLRIVVAYHMLEQGGVLLHSAALADAGGARVFFGPSGAGKSTISRLGSATGRTVLSDDMNALRFQGDAVVVEKLPFAGDFGPSTDTAEGFFRACELYRLEKGPVPAIRALRPAAAVAALLECAPFVNRNPFRYDQLVNVLADLHARLPVRVLTFPPDERTWELLGSSGTR
jgi:hypothetical protein